MYDSLMPTTAPDASSSAPPELPGDMAASVWIRLATFGEPWPDAGIWRLSPDTTPVVTVLEKPSGLPIATTAAPCRGSCCWKAAAGRLDRSVITTARSLTPSVAVTVPATWLPSDRPTWTARLSPTTCAFVTMTPPVRYTTPLPRPVAVTMVTTDGSTRSTRSGRAAGAGARAEALAGGPALCPLVLEVQPASAAVPARIRASAVPDERVSRMVGRG